jgi:hypothetical protein
MSCTKMEAFLQLNNYVVMKIINDEEIAGSQF